MSKPEMKSHKIAVIPGDGQSQLRFSDSTILSPNALVLISYLVFVTIGIGIEVTAAAMKAINAVQKRLGGFSIDAVELDYSSESNEEL